MITSVHSLWAGPGCCLQGSIAICNVDQTVCKFAVCAFILQQHDGGLGERLLSCAGITLQVAYAVSACGLSKQQLMAFEHLSWVCSSGFSDLVFLQLMLCKSFFSATSSAQHQL